MRFYPLVLLASADAQRNNPFGIKRQSVAGRWLPWGAWAECTGVCGAGVQTRTRRCLGGIAGKAAGCSGRTLDSKSCVDPLQDNCAYWSGWSAWGAKTKTCGTARICKTRTCFGREGIDSCRGEPNFCKDVVCESPPNFVVCDPIPMTCCPVSQPDCARQQCYEKNVCHDAVTPLPVQAVDVRLPCCAEWSAFGPWSAPSQSCGVATFHRKRYNVCNKAEEQTEARQENVGEGNWSAWVSEGCNGQKNTMSGPFMCPGTELLRRTHSCYTEGVDKFCSNGEALIFRQTKACGSSLAPVWTDWDKTNADCSQICLNLGAFATRRQVAPCGDIADLKTEVRPCGIPGTQGPMSAWSECDNTCGGWQYRSSTHTCTGEVVTEKRICGARTAWMVGEWDTSTCSANYVCQQEYMTQRLTNVCGEKDPNTGRIIYEQIKTAPCARVAAMPEPVVSVGSCSRSCINPGETAYRVQTTKHFCSATVSVEIPCEVPLCCYPRNNDWSPCDCSAKQIMTQTWHLADGTECDRSVIPPQTSTRDCIPPLNPYKGPSIWSACSNTQCPSLGHRTRYSCPFCENLSESCNNVKMEVTECEGINPSVVMESACNSLCGAAGIKWQWDQDACTGVTSNQRQVECFNPAPECPMIGEYGPCNHERGNANCPGTMTRTRQACTDGNKICQDAVSETVSCGPPTRPAIVVGEWSTCQAPNCKQTRQLTDQCTGEVSVESQDCELGFSQFSIWTTCQAVTTGPFGHICRGTKSRYQRDICGRIPDVVESADCGLELEFMAANNGLTVQNFFDQNRFFNTFNMNSLGQPMWTECTASCAFQQSTGSQTIQRAAFCAGWEGVELKRECSINIENCQYCKEIQPGEWGGCSVSCGLGVERRSYFKMCQNTATGRTWTEPVDRVETRTCGAGPEQVAHYTPCVSENECGGGVYCGIGTRNKVITAVYQDGCASVVVSTSPERCALPSCPYWSAYAGSQCDQCADSRTLTRTCQKPTGAETCNCAADGQEAVVVQQCVPGPDLTWRDYGPWSACSVSCGVGTATRIRQRPCGDLRSETQGGTCGTPGIYLVISNNELVTDTPLVGWGACSSTQCVPGVQTRTLQHSCTGHQKTETRACDAGHRGSWTHEVTEECPAVPICGQSLRVIKWTHTCAQYLAVPERFQYQECKQMVATAGAWGAWVHEKTCYTDVSQRGLSTRRRQWTCNGLNIANTDENGWEVESVVSNIPPCSYWSDWSYTPCNCHNQKAAYATRTCVNANSGLGQTCVGESTSTLSCSDPVIGQLGYQIVVEPWSEFSTCSRSCHISGFGTWSSTQRSYCKDNAGVYEIGVASKVEQCAVPTGGLSEVRWEAINIAEGCGGIQYGMQYHTCGGESNRVQRLVGVTPYWQQWTGNNVCSVSCGGGVITQRRSWSCATDGIADEIISQPCNEHVCNYFGAWSNWAACSVSCGLGTMERRRYCHGSGAGTGGCVADDTGAMLTSTAKCDMGKCCEWDWSGWTGCCTEATQNKNIRLRFRGNNCGQNWDYKMKDCEMQPIPSSQNPFGSCQSLIRAKSSIGVTSGAFVTFFNPDKSVDTTIQQGPTLGHVDDATVTKDATALFSGVAHSASASASSSSSFVSNAAGTSSASSAAAASSSSSVGPFGFSAASSSSASASSSSFVMNSFANAAQSQSLPTFVSGVPWNSAPVATAHAVAAVPSPAINNVPAQMIQQISAPAVSVPVTTTSSIHTIAAPSVAAASSMSAVTAAGNTSHVMSQKTPNALGFLFG